MAHKTYRIQPDQMALLPADTIDFMLDFDQDFVFGYSPTLLKSVCEAHPYLAPKFEAVLVEMAAAVDRRFDNEFERPGTYSLFDDKDWLTNQASVARKVVAAQPAAPAPAPVAEQTRAIAAHSENFAPSADDDLIGTGQETVAQQDAAKAVDVFLPALDIGQFFQPTLFARSGLFGAAGARNSDRRNWPSSSPRVITHFSGQRKGTTSITFTGEELWTGEQELWTSLLSFGATTALGKNVTVRWMDVLHSMPGRGVGGSGPRDRVRSEGNRLKAAALVIRSTDPLVIKAMRQCLPGNRSVQEADKKGFVELSFSLLESFASSSDSITFRISTELRALFGSNLYTWYDREAYYALPTKGLSRRLFLLENSHVDCYPLTVAELTEYLGIAAETPRNVKGYLEKAYEQLRVHGHILACEFRKPTEAERRGSNTACFVITRKPRASKVVEMETVAPIEA